MNPDEVGNMDNSMCIIKIRSLDPFFTKKYDYPKHPNYHLTGDADISQRYINTLDNSLVSVNKSNSVLEAHAARYKKLKEAALRGKAIYTKEVPLDVFVKNRNPDKAIELFDRYSVVDTVKIENSKEEKEAKEAFINEILKDVGEKEVESIAKEISNKKSTSDNEAKPLEAQITRQIAESLPDELDDFAAKFFA